MPDATATPPADPAGPEGSGPERAGSAEPPSGTIAALAAGLVVGLVAVVAVLAARGRDADASTSVPQIDTPLDLVSGAVGVLVVVGVCLVIAMVVAGMRKVDNAAPLAFGSLAGAGIVVGLLIAVAALTDPPEMQVEIEIISPGVEAEDTADAAEDDQAPMWPFLAALALGAAAAAAIPIARTLRRDGPPRDDEPSGEELATRRRVLAGLLDDALDDLRRHPDPREAVIAAWARLETAVEVTGGRRAPSDTPLRFLDRLLRSVSASAPAVSRLTATFEQAMFSEHPIGPDDQAAAVDALVAVRDELGAAPELRG